MKSKLSFINGECECPARESSKCQPWEKCDDMVTSWILNSLMKEIKDCVE